MIARFLCLIGALFLATPAIAQVIGGGSGLPQPIINGDCLIGQAGNVAAWNACPGGGASSVANSDGTLTISPTTGAVVASLALGHANTWTGQQTFVAPILGTPASGVATNLTGTASGLTAGNVTTNANLTGPITSSGNATAIASQTGTGSTFVVNTSPTLITPILGVAAATSINKVTLTAPATSSTLTIADGKTLTDTSAVGAVALKGATGGGFAQAACADLSNAGTGCSATIANYLPLAGGTLTGELITLATATGGAGFNLPPGTAPTSPANGDLWTTSAGIYARINGSTVGPLAAGGYTAPTIGSTSIGSGATVTAITGMASWGITAPAANSVAETISGASHTGSNATSDVSWAGTWNTTGSPTAFLMNWTNTASGATAKLMDLQVGSVTQFNVDKAGDLNVAGNITTGNGFYIGKNSTSASIVPAASGGITINGYQAAAYINLNADSVEITSYTGGSHSFITNNGAAITQLGVRDAASPVAQTFGAQNVVAGNTNTAGANFTISGSLSNGSGGGDLLLATTLSSAASGTQNTAATALTLKGGTQNALFAALAVLKGYTVAALPTGVTGAYAYVTDQLTTCAVAGAALTGGGAVTCPVFYNGSAWVGG